MTICMIIKHAIIGNSIHIWWFTSVWPHHFTRSGSLCPYNKLVRDSFCRRFFVRLAGAGLFDLLEPWLQQVEQKAVGRQRNLGLIINVTLTPFVEVPVPNQEKWAVMLMVSFPPVYWFLRLNFGTFNFCIFRHFQQYFSYIAAVGFIGGRVPGENNWPVTSHWQTLWHNVVLITSRHDSKSQL